MRPPALASAILSGEVVTLTMPPETKGKSLDELKQEAAAPAA